MEEADAILIEGLNLVGCNVPSEVTSCKALVEEDSALFYQCCVVLLKLIDDSKEFPAKLPKHMSGRVSACTNVSVEIKNMGYRGDLGYHQLLYPNEQDARNVLMFLSKSVPETTPEAVADAGDANLSLGEYVRRRIGGALATAVKEDWTKEYRDEKYGQQAAFTRFHSVPVRIPNRGRVIKVTPGLEMYFRDFLPPVGLQVAKWNDTPAALFEAISVGNIATKQREAEKQLTLDSGVNPIQYKQKKKAQIQHLLYMMQ